MLKITHINLWVHDQDDALAFYTEKVGLEVRDERDRAGDGQLPLADGGTSGQPEVAFVLNVPGPPVMDAETAEQLTALVATGVADGFHFSTEDCRAAYEELRSRGVEFHEEPSERPYGVDAAFRDPSGHVFRLVQPR